MSRKEDIKSLKEKTEALHEQAILDEMAEYDEGGNTKETRDKFMRIVHYYHLLNQLGETDNDKDLEAHENTYALLREKISKIRNKDKQFKEIIKVNLVNAHMGAFHIAEHFYEKASKTLCQMMITLMDYMLQEKANMTVLYTSDTESHRSYFSLLDEITALNAEYVDSFYYLCAYDFCNEILGEYLGIKEYNLLVKEHQRIIDNGLPEKVSRTMAMLNDIISNDRIKAEVFFDINRTYTPVPEYDRDKMQRCYDRILNRKYGNSSDVAMTDFVNLATILDYAYVNSDEI